MKYAVVRIQGKQHLVTAGRPLIVDRLPGKEKDKVEFKEVLLTIEPLVKGAAVTAVITAQSRGEKIRVSKFKSKSRYRRVKGHRQWQTELKVVKI